MSSAVAPHVLTRQQRHVMRLLALGCTYKAIAQRLQISERTVGLHVATARERLGATSRANAVALAVSRGEIAQPRAVARSRRQPIAIS